MAHSIADPPTQPLTESTFCILAALSEPRHGYAVMQWVAEATAGRVKLGPGTLYGALTGLQDKGLIVPAGEREEGAERRKVYALTERGRSALTAEVARLDGLHALGLRALETLGGGR
ncbi:MAG: Transcriptional regulator PadR-like family protein [Acidobacteria bacterium ADurb.Bin340]|nr:MAG: Transcriptional regulator PadR-like family protein [Acidobacteria bacterium ADurb.Bin340]HQL47636.1 PadR family transcriptional regulator [Holophaga sp.]